MSFFSKRRDSEEQQAYEAFMTGYRLGFPVEDDQPSNLHIDPNDEKFRTGLETGMKDHQDNQDFLAEHPDLLAGDEDDETEDQPEEPRGFFARLFGH